jgi:hypothetical protein
MDKATILSDAAKYVKELQQRLKALEEEAAAAAGNAGRSNETAVPVKKPRNVAVAVAPDENGSPSTTTSASSSGPSKPALPEIQARFSEKSAMVRVQCGSGKGVAVAVLAEVEELGLSIVHANVMPFSDATVIITITAKASRAAFFIHFRFFYFILIIRLHSLLHYCISSANCTDNLLFGVFRKKKQTFYLVYQMLFLVSRLGTSNSGRT